MKEKPPSGSFVGTQTSQGAGMALVSIGDPLGREAHIATFGEQVVSGRRDDISAKFAYGISDEFFKPRGITESATITTPSSVLTMSTGTTTGSVAEIETSAAIRYVSGHDAESYFTVAFPTDTAGTDGFARIGPYDAVDGWYLEAADGTFYTVLISNGVVIRKIPRSEWDDPMDGSDKSASKFVWDHTKMNIFVVRYGYLGIAPGNFVLKAPRTTTKDGCEISGAANIGFNVIDLRNQIAGVNFENPFLPMRAEVDNGTSTTDIRLLSGSWNGGIIANPQTDPESKHFALEQLAALDAGVLTNLITIHSKTLFAGKSNRVPFAPIILTFATDGTKTFSFRVLKNATLAAGDDFANVNTNESTMEFREDAVAVVDPGVLLFPMQLGKSASTAIQFGHDEMVLHPGDTLTIAALSSNAGDASVGIRWHEFF